MGFPPAREWHGATIWVKTSFEKAYRLPSERELFGDEVLETGDVSLKPENSRNINFNISYSSVWNKVHSAFIDVGAIYRDTKDYIRRRIEQRYGGAFYTNHGKALNLGVDCEARYFYAVAGIQHAVCTLVFPQLGKRRRRYCHSRTTVARPSLTCTFNDGRYNIAFEARNIADEILYDEYSLQKPGRSFMIKIRYFFFRNAK